LKRDGTVVAWGDDSYGWIRVPAGLTNAIAATRGWTHGLALRDNGTVIGWGENPCGETNVPVWLTNVVAICGGISHSLALVALPSDVVPRLSSPMLVNTRFSVTMPTVEGASYFLEFKNSLSDTEWTPQPVVRGYGFGVPRVLTDPETTAPARFYRVRMIRN
jgi:hypothetical protein